MCVIDKHLRCIGVLLHLKGQRRVEPFLKIDAEIGAVFDVSSANSGSVGAERLFDYVVARLVAVIGIGIVIAAFISDTRLYVRHHSS